jgi:hypothetical protein
LAGLKHAKRQTILEERETVTIYLIPIAQMLALALLGYLLRVDRDE